MSEDDLIYRLRKRAEIRRQIQTRKSVQNGEPDRLADLLEGAADAIEVLRAGAVINAVSTQYLVPAPTDKWVPHLDLSQPNMLKQVPTKTAYHTWE